MQPDGLSVTATGTQIQLITDAPSLNEDVLVVLPKGVSDYLNSTYEEFCPNGLDSPECQVSLVSLGAYIKIDQNVIEKRILPVVAAGVFAAWTGMVIAYVQMYQHENAISRIRVPSRNLEKMLAVQSSSTIVVATQTSGGNMITVVPNPTGGYVHIS